VLLVHPVKIASRGKGHLRGVTSCSKQHLTDEVVASEGVIMIFGDSLTSLGFNKPITAGRARAIRLHASDCIAHMAMDVHRLSHHAQAHVLVQISLGHDGRVVALRATLERSSADCRLRTQQHLVFGVMRYGSACPM
jgi:hypothetical protein